MKRKAWVFVVMTVLVLLAVPVINIKLGTTKEGYRWWSRTVLFNLDFTLPYLEGLLYPLGISISPDNTIIGKNGWLYLGDQYMKTMTAGRYGPSNNDAALAQNISQATKSWRERLRLKGVSAYRIMVAANKSSIYPEFLPDWARPAGYSVADMLLANVDKDIYMDTRPALLAAKPRYPVPLYYKTDTHWNSLAHGSPSALSLLALPTTRSCVGLAMIKCASQKLMTVMAATLPSFCGCKNNYTILKWWLR